MRQACALTVIVLLLCGSAGWAAAGAADDQAVDLRAAGRTVDLSGRAVTVVRFDDLWRDAKIVGIGGIEIRIASISRIIKMKETAGRSQDLADLERLRAMLVDRTNPRLSARPGTELMGHLGRCGGPAALVVQASHAGAAPCVAAVGTRACLSERCTEAAPWR